MTSPSHDLHDDERPGPSLALATDQLRSRTANRAVEIADNVMLRALRTPRRSRPVRAHPPHEYLQVSDRVIIAALRRSIDDDLEDAAVANIVLDITREHELASIVIELIAQYGSVLLDTADQARSIASAVIPQLLGAASDVPITAAVAAETAHVHVCDITRGNPHLVDPQDE